VYSLAQWRTTYGQDAHSFVTTASQLFVNAAGRDYHLKAGSAAINAGTVMSAAPPATDFDGNARPAGGAYDIGAFEAASTGAADTTSPVLSGIASGGLTTGGATVSWATDESADTQVEYGTSTSYGSSSTLNTTMVTSHSAALSG